MQTNGPFGTAGSRSAVAQSIDGLLTAPQSMNSRRLLAGRRAQRPQPISRKDFDELLLLAEKDSAGRDLIDIAMIVYFTGLRPTELTRLRWKDVDLKKRSMSIVSSKGHQERRVPFAGTVLKVLKGRKGHQRKMELVFGRHALSRASQQLSALTLGIHRSPVSLHVLRESFVANWVKAGGNLAQLAYITRGSALIRNLSSEMSFDQLYFEAARFQAKLEEFEAGCSTPHGEPVLVKRTMRPAANSASPSSVEVSQGSNE